MKIQNQNNLITISLEKSDKSLLNSDKPVEVLRNIIAKFLKENVSLIKTYSRIGKTMKLKIDGIDNIVYIRFQNPNGFSSLANLVKLKVAKPEDLGWAWFNVNLDTDIKGAPSTRRVWLLKYQIDSDNVYISTPSEKLPIETKASNIASNKKGA